MESKALALGKQVKAEALNSSVPQMEVTLFFFAFFEPPTFYQKSSRFD